MACPALWSRTPPLLGAVGLSLTVPLLTGFMHLDGFMDVSDALLSGREREEKLRILKDPHAGAFSVVALVCLLLFQTAAAHAALSRGGSLAALWLLPVISRALAGLSLMSLAPLFIKQLWEDGVYVGYRGPARLLRGGAAAFAAFRRSWGGAPRGCALAALGFAAPCAGGPVGRDERDVAGWSICIAEAVRAGRAGLSVTRKRMILIVGGAYQGKRAYSEALGLDEGASWTRLRIRKWVDEGWTRDGDGTLPSAWRDKALRGRLLRHRPDGRARPHLPQTVSRCGTLLKERAARVRVFCGIGTVIKDA